jgi:hypothetical protein
MLVGERQHFSISLLSRPSGGVDVTEGCPRWRESHSTDTPTPHPSISLSRTSMSRSEDSGSDEVAMLMALTRWKTGSTSAWRMTKATQLGGTD